MEIIQAIILAIVIPGSVSSFLGSATARPVVSIDTIACPIQRNIQKKMRKKRNRLSILRKKFNNHGYECIGKECYKHGNYIPLNDGFSTRRLFTISSRKNIKISCHKK